MRVSQGGSFPGFHPGLMEQPRWGWKTKIVDQRPPTNVTLIRFQEISGSCHARRPLSHPSLPHRPEPYYDTSSGKRPSHLRRLRGPLPRQTGVAHLNHRRSRITRKVSRNEEAPLPQEPFVTSFTAHQYHFFSKAKALRWDRL